MADFVSQFWNWFIIIPTVLGLIGCAWLLIGNTEKRSAGEVEALDHVWDEDLQEFNNPLPRWWLMMFYITLVFAVFYLVLYPGLGTFKGMLGWTEVGQYEAEMQAADSTYGPLYEKYAAIGIDELQQDPEAMKTGARLFANYCTACHGSDGGGARGFPSLRDHDWLWGGSPEQVNASIMNGRIANMPPKGGLPLTEEETQQVTDYVLTLSGREADAASAKAGQAIFGKICVACHMPTGQGNQALGAPNLTDQVWLYGASRDAIFNSINNGRNGTMPAHGEFLGKEKVHLLTAYVLSLPEK